MLKIEKSGKTTDVPTNDEKLIWLLQTILKEQVPLPYSGSCSMVELDKLQVAPHLDDSDQAECFSILDEVINDKDFYRKHNMLNYKPSYSFDYSHTESSNDIAVFCDFTHDFIKTYLEDRLGIKSGIGINLQKTKKKQLYLPDLPNDLKWGEITIRFLNGDEVQITARKLVYHENYELMGFKDEKTKNPNLQWKFLKTLSLINGFLNWDNNKNLDTKQRNNVKKRKQELSETLKKYFHTVKDDPFFDYKKENGYRIKIQLIPEQGSNLKNTIETMNDDDIGADNQDFFDEQTSNLDNW